MTVELSDHEIFAAADAVLASGFNVTPKRVREVLKRGNPVHIGAQLDRWWAQLMQEETRPALLDKAIAMLWDQALIMAREEATRAIADERQVWIEQSLQTEKTFVGQYRTLEQLLTKESQVFFGGDLQSRRLFEQMRERLRQLRSHLKSADLAVLSAEENLNSTKRQLTDAQATASKYERQCVKYEMELQALYSELLSRPIGASSMTLSETCDDQKAKPVLDFWPLLSMAQASIQQRLNELRRPLTQVGIGAGAEEVARREGQLEVVRHLCYEFSRQANAYRHVANDLYAEFSSIYWGGGKKDE
ncbi:DNA-binding protein [Pseudomonas tritici]|uniref:DNA-binding protein n=1 Tax=Pseudomonas tritici TaxID=2745518 RepID=UPI00387B4C00